jgi:VWFA-related protein
LDSAGQVLVLTRKRFAAVLSLLIILAAVNLVVYAQTQGEQPTFRVSVNLVHLDAIVMDAKGQHVTDLKPQDFEVLQDGRRQQITACSYVRLAGTSASAAPQVTASKRGRIPPPIVPDEALTREQVRRTIVFVVDDRSFPPTTVPYVQRALKKIFNEQIEPGDLAALLRTSGGEGALERFTSDKRILLAAASNIRWVPLGLGTSEMNPTDFTGQYVRLASLNQTSHTLTRAIRALENVPGQKAIVFLSQDWFNGDGDYDVKIGQFSVPNATGYFVDEAIRAGVAIYTIDPGGLDPLMPGADYDLMRDYDRATNYSRWKVGRNPGPNPQIGRLDPELAAQLPAIYHRSALLTLYAKRSGLEDLARGTGGRFIADTNDVAWGISKVLDDVQGYYSIAFKPDDAERYFGPREDAAPFHRLTVRVKRKGVHVRYHAGFIGWRPRSNRGDSTLTEPGLIANALTSPFLASDIRLRLTPLFNISANGAAVSVLLYIDAHDVAFTRAPDGRHRAALEMVARTIDENGTALESVRKTISLQLEESSFQRAMMAGLLYQANIPAPKPGYHEVRIVVQDSATNKIGIARE